MPTARIGIYVCCFPCNPWSIRGKRLGFKAGDGSVIWESIKTIKHLNPALIFMENVLNIQKTHSDTSGDSDEPHITQADLGVIRDYMQTELPVYEFQVLSPLTPGHAGYPTLKPRLAMLGGHLDMMQKGALLHTFGLLSDATVPQVYDWRMFLGRPYSYNLLEQDW